MGKLVEVVHVSLGGEVSSTEWAMPFLDDEFGAYASATLDAADALFLGRKTYEGLAPAYQAMDSTPFVDRMNAIPKYVATTTLTALEWNAVAVPDDVAGAVSKLKTDLPGTLLRYGNGPLDALLMDERLIDEFHMLLTPVATGGGTHMFEYVGDAPQLQLLEVHEFRSGVLRLVYAP